MKRSKFLSSLGILAAIGLLSSCSKNTDNSLKIKSSSNRIYKTEELKNILKSSFPRTYISTSDKFYKDVDLDWIKNQYYPYFKQDLFNKDIVNWDEKFDCDKFARYFSALIQVIFFRDYFHSWTDAQSLTVGEVYYLINGDKEKGHAINLIIHDGKVSFFEPQTGRFVSLSQKEQESIYFIRI